MYVGLAQARLKKILFYHLLVFCRKMENEDIKEDVLSSIDSIDRKRPREPCREDDNQHVERRVRLMRPQYEEKELEEEGTTNG